LAEVPAEAARRAMLAGVRELGIEALPWEREARDLQARIEFVRATAGAAETGEDAWPAVSDAALADTLESWLAPWLEGITRREHLSRVPLAAALRARLSFEQQRALEEWAPAELSMPSRSEERRVGKEWGARGAAPACNRTRGYAPSESRRVGTRVDAPHPVAVRGR